jgi:glycolate oxidase subunit GlcD
LTAILRSNLRTAAGKELARLLGPGSLVLTGPADLLAYSYDATGARHLPEVVVLPDSTADTVAAVRWAARRRLPVVARGAGTNLSGGTVPVSGGVVIHLSRLNRIISVDTAARRVVVGPGVTNLALQDYLAPMGFAYAPDPASQKVSTLGGNVGENAGGPHCLKYGVTVDHVLGLTAVLADGEVVRLGYDAARDQGLAATSALVGSEGTLALFTELVLRLEPLPPDVRTILAVYDRLEDAGRTVSEIIARRMLPATLELMDRTTLNTVEESFRLGYPTDAEGALIIEIDGPAPGMARQLRQIESICRENGARSVAVARDDQERAKLWLGRRAAFGALARRSPIYSVQDITVPRNRLVEMMRHVEDVLGRHQLEVAIVAHAGDGNLHPIVLYREATPERLARVHSANLELMSHAVQIGGTISGEHGVGTEKLAFLHLAVPPSSLALMRRVKAAFDPSGLLNPGKAVPPAEGPEHGAAPSAESPGQVAAPSSEGPEHGAAPSAEGPEHGTAPSAEGPRGLAGDPAAAARRTLRSLCQAQAAGRGSRLSWAGNRRLEVVSAPSGMLDLDETNLTVTALAGTPVAELRAKLAEAGFWLPPLDHGYDGTLGGDVATAVPAPTAAQQGGIARWLLGAELLLSSGETVSLGGRTMKNVAGYNLLHLLAGSYGRLGLIWSLTMRLWPMPEADRTLAMPVAGLAEPGVTAERLGRMVRATRPVALAAVGGGSLPDCLLVRVAGLAEDVEWASQQWRAQLPLSRLDDQQAAAAWARWSAPLARASGSGQLWDIASHPGEVAATLAALSSATANPGGGCGDAAWTLCLISGQGSFAQAAAGDAGAGPPPTGPPGVAGLRRAGPHGQGPLDARLRAAFDARGVFAGEVGE